MNEAAKKFILKFPEKSSSMKNEYIMQAETALETLEFPSLKDENWKYTKTSHLLKSDIVSAEKIATSNAKPIVSSSIFLQVINGKWASTNNTYEGLEISEITNEKQIGSLSDQNQEAFSALNLSRFTSGIFIRVKQNSVIEQVIEILDTTTGDNIGVNTRYFFEIEKNASVKVIHRFKNQGAKGFSNITTEAIVNENASLEYYILDEQNETSSKIHSTFIKQKKDSKILTNTTCLNSGLVRNNLKVWSEGSNTETNLFGLYSLAGKAHTDNHTFIEHVAPNCTSNELYKGVIGESATAVFNGKVYVHPEAQKTNAFQSNQNILLDEKASVNSKPELEIYADDVKCSHGSTTGQMDEEALFYLRARGVNKKEAKKLLVNAFFNDVIESITIEELKSYVEEKTHQSLS